MGCPHVRKIIHSLKLVDYLHVQADNPWYNYYVFLLKIVFILATNADPDEIPSYAAFHLGLHCLPKYLFTHTQNEKS